MTDTMERQDTRLSDPGTEEEIIAHIVKKDDQMRGYIMGEEIEAICGTMFVPSRDYEGKPVCVECLVILERIRGG